jgi:hypothetical protein
MTDQVHVALLDEGVNVWRPVPGRKLRDNVYELLRPADYDPDDEKWEFPPGSIVQCAPRTTSSGTILAAVAMAPVNRRQAAG